MTRPVDRPELPWAIRCDFTNIVWARFVSQPLADGALRGGDVGCSHCRVVYDPQRPAKGERRKRNG